MDSSRKKTLNQPSVSARLGARIKEAGNIFLTLFGAIGMVGVIGASTMTVMQGPVKTMSEVTKRTVAENNMIAAGKLALMASLNQTGGGDCDTDSVTEPVEMSATAIPGFVGGSEIPATIGTSKEDSWGMKYGYCAWDHGLSVDAGGCSGQNRLAGADVVDQYVLAIISAGPDGVFDTTCNDYIDVGGDGEPDIALVNKTSGADDLVLGYTYEEATALSGGLWNVESSDPDTAEIAKDISVKGSDAVERFAFEADSGNLQIGGEGKFPVTSTDVLQSFTGGGVGTTIAVNSALNASEDISTTADIDGVNIAASGTLSGGATTVSSLDAGSGAIQTTGTLDAGTTTLGGLTASSATISGALGAGATSVTSLSASGLISTTGNVTLGDATTDTVTIAGVTTIGDTLDVTGDTDLSTLGTSGLATLESLAVTNGTNLNGGVNLGTTAADLINVNGTLTFNSDLDMGNGTNKIVDLATPTDPADATTKAYVDAAVAAGTGYTEDDPQVDTLTPGMYCVSNAGGTAIDCTATVSDDDTLASLSCTDGQVAAWDNTGSAWVCADAASGGGGSGSGGGSVISFSAYGTASRDGSGYMYNFGTVDHDADGAYDNATGEFTAPEDGTYQFSAVSLKSATTTNFSTRIYVNGVGVGGYGYAAGGTGVHSGYTTAPVTSVVQLSAGDKVTAYINAAGAGTQSFSGFKIGSGGGGGGAGSGGWETVALTDTDDFDLSCEYRAYLEPTQVYYSTRVHSDTLTFNDIQGTGTDYRFRIQDNNKGVYEQAVEGTSTYSGGSTVHAIEKNCGGGSGSGSDTLAGLSCTDGQVAAWNNGSSAWECADGGSGGSGGSTLQSGWPDVIACDNGATTRWLMHINGASDGSSAFYKFPHDTLNVDLSFSSPTAAGDDDGTLSGYDCDGMTIADLYAQDKAFNFVGGGSDTLAGLSCTDGQVAAWDDAGSAWVCANDQTGSGGGGGGPASCSPAEEGAISNANLNGADGVFVSGNYAYVTSYDADSLTVVDVSTPASPSQVGTISNANLNGAIMSKVVGNYAYVVSFDADSLTVIDISNPASPSQTGVISNASLNGAEGVDVVGNYAYVSSYNADSLTVIDISNPASPSQVGTISNTNLNGAQGVKVSGNYAYVISELADSLTVIDISNPASPSQVGTISNTNLNGAEGLDVEGSYAYVTAYDASALTIIDVSTPASPSQVGTISNASINGTSGVDVVGDYAYVGGYDADSLTIIDVSDPASPSELATISNANLNAVERLHVVNGLVYVTAYNSDSLTIIDPACSGGSGGGGSGDNLGDHTATTDIDVASNNVININSLEFDALAGDAPVSGSGTLSDLTCTDGQIAKWNNGGSVWECSDDTGSDNLGNHTATQALDMNSNSVDNVTKVTFDSVTGAAAPASSSGSLSDLSCGDGQVAKWDNGGGVWVCANDNDTDTDTDTLASLSCADGQVAQWNNTSGLWECATAGGGGLASCVTRTASNASSITCNGGETMTGGGGYCGNFEPYDLVRSHPSGNGWYAMCTYYDSGWGIYEFRNPNTIYVRCCS